MNKMHNQINKEYCYYEAFSVVIRIEAGSAYEFNALPDMGI